MEKEKLTKDEFIRIVAERSGESILQIKGIWGIIEETIKDVIYFENELVIPGLFKIYVTTVPEHLGHNAVKDEPMIVREAKRINFKASRALLKLFKERQDRKANLT